MSLKTVRVRLSGNTKITSIPVEFCEKLKITAGTILTVQEINGGICMIPLAAPEIEVRK